MDAKTTIFHYNKDNQALFNDFTKDEPWRIFRIMAEFIDSFETMSSQGPLITVFGSARTRPEHPDYQEAEKLGRLLVQEGYGVLTGGGPGIMEAANKGAYLANGKSVGLNIELPAEQSANQFLNAHVDFRYFFIRKVNFLKYALGVVVFPGGFGTLDELMETLTLLQTNKINRIPLVAVRKSFWQPLHDFMTGPLLQEHLISRSDPGYISIVDSAEEAVSIIKEAHKNGFTQTVKR